MIAVKNVLVMSTDEEISSVLERLIGEMDEFEGTLCKSLDSLPDVLERASFDILLQGAGFPAAEEEQIAELTSKRNPGIVIVSHYGGGSGLLYTELVGSMNHSEE